MKRVSTCFWLTLAALLPLFASAQVDHPYHVNGTAFQETCNCYTLTPDQNFVSGSMWNINKISLNEPFDFKFNVFLGCTDGDGADGIAFVLQPISTSIGSDGGGIGFDGVTPSIGVLLDTWQNFEDNDPVYDHISIQKNGIIDHGPTSDLAPPVTALASGGNIEDCQWHVLRINWDPASKVIITYVDGVERIRSSIDLVADIFGGDDRVFWGFTAATGGSKNLQKVCTSLNPNFSIPYNQTTCFPEPITFVDSSTSFGSIEKWFWDFGDGTTSELQNPPVHNYAAPGNYDVKLAILGNNGCVSDTLVKTVVMGSEPLVRYSYPTPVCEGTPVEFRDSSYVEFGTINEWNWNIAGVAYTDQHPPAIEMTGQNNISLSVRTQEGCVSDVSTGIINSYPKPSVDFVNSDVCFGQPAIFNGVNLNSSVPVTKWTWQLGNGSTQSTVDPSLNYMYPDGGEYSVSLTGYSNDGCGTSVVTKPQKVYRTNAYAGNDTIIAIGQAIQLHASGGDFYKWTPSTGLSADNIPDPIVTLDRDAQFVLQATSIIGCPTYDTLRFKVYKGPELYVPSAFSPNNDGKNDELRFIAVGMKSVELFEVFNRYGQRVYSSREIMKGWNGKFNGITQPSGTYVWMIKGTDLLGNMHFKKGTVTLVR